MRKPVKNDENNSAKGFEMNRMNGEDRQKKSYSTETQSKLSRVRQRGIMKT